jgi:hypothetical protein
MHIIDRKWTDLAAGYRALQSLEARLEAEFGRAVQVGHKQQFRRELTGWQKKRRTFFLLVLMALLSIVALCLTAFYFRDVACVVIYWVVLVLMILVTLAVAGRNYIREVINRPEPKRVDALSVDLEQRWWDSLAPKEAGIVKADEKSAPDFLTLLSRGLPDSYFAVRGLFTSGGTDSDLLVLGPSGGWVFAVLPWKGTVLREEGLWKQVLFIRDKLGRKQRDEKIIEQAPDEQWSQWTKKIVPLLEEYFPEKGRGLIQGGLVFTDPKVRLDRENIQGNLASYGTASPWADRVLHAPAVDGFTLENQLEVLDKLAGRDKQAVLPVSAKDEAERLYQQVALELRESVAKMVE